MRRTVNPAWATLILVLSLGAAVSAQTQKPTKKVQVSGKPVATTSVVTGEVVQVAGSDLVVKLSDGEIKTFHVPAKRTFEIDGKEVTVSELKPGTTLTATVTTTTTPVTVRTKSVQSGRVVYAGAPTVILQMPDGQNKQFTVREEDKVEFMVAGRPATVFDLKPGMNVSAQKIVEAPDVRITTDTKVTGHAPQPVAPAAAPASAPPAAAPGATPESAPAGAPSPVEPAAGSAGNALLWIGLVAVLIIVGVLVIRRRAKK
jgi:LPXTG-motif cell wall-anchored protein